MASKSDVTVKDLAARIAKAKGMPEDKTAKMLRSRIRGNFDLLATKQNWPGLVTSGKGNKDGNRYVPMPAATAEALFKAMTKGTALKETLGKAPRVRKPKAVDAPPTPKVEA